MYMCTSIAVGIDITSSPDGSTSSTWQSNFCRLALLKVRTTRPNKLEDSRNRNKSPLKHRTQMLQFKYTVYTILITGSHTAHFWLGHCRMLCA